MKNLAHAYKKCILDELHGLQESVILGLYLKKQTFCSIFFIVILFQFSLSV